MTAGDPDRDDEEDPSGTNRADSEDPPGDGGPSDDADGGDEEREHNEDGHDESADHDAEESEEEPDAEQEPASDESDDESGDGGEEQAEGDGEPTGRERREEEVGGAFAGDSPEDGFIHAGDDYQIDQSADDEDGETEAEGDGGAGESGAVSDDSGESGDADDASEEDGITSPSDDVTISGGAAPPTPEEPEPVAASAPDDQEMPLTAHIEEMVKRLAVVIVIMALVSAVVFPIADRLINFLWYSFLPGQPSQCVEQAAAAAGNFTNGTTGTLNASATNGTAGSSTAACPRLYHPIALVLARLKVASLGGFIIALPVFVYQTYLFMRPGLYPNERRYYLASVPTSLVLAAIGVGFAYLLVLPIIFTYFLGYSQPVASVAFGLTETFDLILLMLGMFAAIFQIPLFVMLAIMMGVTTRRWLEDRRLYFWFGFAGVAFLFSPDPTGMAPFIVALTMIVLFEGTLLLLRWTGR